MELFVFTCASVMVLVGALGVIFRKHPVHAALSLVLTLFGIAVLFVAQSAEFLAAVDRKSTRLNSSHSQQSRMPSSA